MKTGIISASLSKHSPLEDEMLFWEQEPLTPKNCYQNKGFYSNKKPPYTRSRPH